MIAMVNRRRRRRAWSLFELLLVLPLFAAVAASFVRGYRIQNEAQLRYARVAEQDMALQSLLGQLRRDCAEALEIAEAEHERARPADWSEDEKQAWQSRHGFAGGDVRVDWTPFAFCLSTPRGDICYAIIETAPLYDVPRGSLLPAAPATQVLVRTDDSGGERRWTLGLLSLSCAIQPASRRPAQLTIAARSSARMPEGRSVVRQHSTTFNVGVRR